MTPIAQAHITDSDDIDFTVAHSEDGIDRAEDLARSAFDCFVDAADAAKLDTTIAAIFLAVDLLAAVQHHSGATPEEIISQFGHLIRDRVADYEDGGTCLHCMTLPEAALH